MVFAKEYGHDDWHDVVRTEESGRTDTLCGRTVYAETRDPDKKPLDGARCPACVKKSKIKAKRDQPRTKV